MDTNAVIIKLLDSKPGIVINALGVDIVGAYLINWDDIIDYSTAQEGGNYVFLLYVQNPDEYIAAANDLKRRGMRISMDEYKTPFSISPDPYQCDFDELKAAILEGMKRAALAKRKKP